MQRRIPWVEPMKALLFLDPLRRQQTAIRRSKGASFKNGLTYKAIAGIDHTVVMSERNEQAPLTAQPGPFPLTTIPPLMGPTQVDILSDQIYMMISRKCGFASGLHITYHPLR